MKFLLDFSQKYLDFLFYNLVFNIEILGGIKISYFIFKISRIGIYSFAAFKNLYFVLISYVQNSSSPCVLIPKLSIGIKVISMKPLILLHFFRFESGSDSRQQL